eukprot:6559720-Heterocapsa_arctica.AAC.1
MTRPAVGLPSTLRAANRVRQLTERWGPLPSSLTVNTSTHQRTKRCKRRLQRVTRPHTYCPCGNHT